MTATLPQEVRQVLDSFVTTEFTTLDARGRPITWPVTPYHHVEAGCVDITTGIGYPKKARDAEANPKVALLFSDPTGSGLDRPPMVLLQGTAEVDERDLDANRARYERESAAKLPDAQAKAPPEALRKRFFLRYYARIYVHVRPERVYVWPDGDPAREPQLLDTHLEEVRSGHSEEPEVPAPPPEGGAATWDRRIDDLGRRHPTAVLSWPAPDGFPFSVRVPVHADAQGRRIRIEAAEPAAPLRAGPACLTAHATTSASPTRRTSSSAATSSRTRAGGRSRPAGSWAGSSHRSRSSRPTRRTPRRSGASTGPRGASSRAADRRPAEGRCHRFAGPSRDAGARGG